MGGRGEVLDEAPGDGWSKEGVAAAGGEDGAGELLGGRQAPGRRSAVIACRAMLRMNYRA